MVRGHSARERNAAWLSDGKRRPRSTTYAAGLVTGFLAVVALGWLVKRSFDRGAEGWPLDVLVDRPESLLLLIAVLMAIGIGGLFLAADSPGIPAIIGYALFVVSVLFIAWNLKHLLRPHRPPAAQRSRLIGLDLLRQRLAPRLRQE